ncbi:MAG: hypothetical protein IJA22_00280, partial [Clostridia bacterium]|nr:hypothetical protein [Clostridia bacterium]
MYIIRHMISIQEKDIDISVCFAGHRYEWHCVGASGKLYKEIINLIDKGCKIFYIGLKGAFDNLVAQTLLEIKKKYPEIKIIQVLSSYNPNKKTESFDASIYPPLENIFYKQRITKRNEWMVLHSKYIICKI